MKNIFHFLFNKLFAQLLMRSTPGGEIKKILISGYTGLGHFILRTALINKIEELYPECEIFVIAGDKDGSECVVPERKTFILWYDSGLFRKVLFFLKLRKEKIDVIFLSFDASPAFLIKGSILAGIPIRVGHLFEEVPVPSYYYTHKVAVRRDENNQIDWNLDLLQALYTKGFSREHRLSIHPNTKLTILNDYALNAGNYICIQIAGANGALVAASSKIWIEDNFKILIEELLMYYQDLKIVALGDKGDSIRVNRVCDKIISDRLLNLSGKTTIQEVISIISSCKLLICHDSGLMHLGNALQKNVIALHGMSEPDIYQKNLSTCHILQKKCDCPGLGSIFPYNSDYACVNAAAGFALCMERLTVEEVYAKCVELLDGNPKMNPVSFIEV